MSAAEAALILVVVINHGRTQMKVHYFDCIGYCLWSKRLERGQCYADRSAEDKQPL